VFAAFANLFAGAVFLGMPLPLKVLSRAAAAVLDELTADLGVGQSRKVDRGTGYMAVHIECLDRSGLGLLFSIALLRAERRSLARS
jgi:hypothetical protein